MPVGSTIEVTLKPTPNRQPTAAKLTGRSRVSNGKDVFLVDVDERGRPVRRFRDVLSQLVSDLGGDPSEAQSIIARRAATLTVWCELAEAEMANGSADFDVGRYTTAANSLRRLCAALGLERRARDITPDLQSYAAMKAKEREVAS